MNAHDNIKARDYFTAMLVNLRARTVGLEESAAEALFGWTYKQPGMAQHKDCHAMYVRVLYERGQEDARALLQRFALGCQGDISTMYIGMCKPFFEYAATCLYYGVSPRDGWVSIDDVSDDMRDRWLLYHPESEALWEVRGAMPVLDLANDEVCDVSGIAHHEKRWVEQQAGKPSDADADADQAAQERAAEAQFDLDLDDEL